MPRPRPRVARASTCDLTASGSRPVRRLRSPPPRRESSLRSLFRTPARVAVCRFLPPPFCSPPCRLPFAALQKANKRQKNGGCAARRSVGRFCGNLSADAPVLQPSRFALKKQLHSNCCNPGASCLGCFQARKGRRAAAVSPSALSAVATRCEARCCRTVCALPTTTVELLAPTPRLPLRQVPHAAPEKSAALCGAWSADSLSEGHSPWGQATTKAEKKKHHTVKCSAIHLSGKPTTRSSPTVAGWVWQEEKRQGKKKPFRNLLSLLTLSRIAY